MLQVQVPETATVENQRIHVRRRGHAIDPHQHHLMITGRDLRLHGALQPHRGAGDEDRAGAAGMGGHIAEAVTVAGPQRAGRVLLAGTA